MPADTAIFATALLVALLFDMLTAGFTTAVQAEGRIAVYQCAIGLLLCISVPMGYLFLRLHMPASSVLWAVVGSSALASAGRLWFLCNRIGLQGSEWFKGVLLPCVVTCVACCLAMGAVVISVKPGLLRLVWLYGLNSAVATILACAFASSARERRLYHSYASQVQERAFSGSRRVLAFATRRL